jgi:hypothetical protein
MTLNLNVKLADGSQGFITPRIVVTTGKESKEVPASLALDVAYIVKALVDGDTNSYTDKTKGDSAILCQKAITAIAKDSVYNVYMPTLDTSRKDTDLAKWTLVTTVKQADVLVVCNALATSRATMQEAEGKVSELAKAVKVEAYTVTQPVYFTGTTTTNKRGGGKKEVTSLF